MRKIIVCILCFVLCTLCFTSCTKSHPTTTEVIPVDSTLDVIQDTVYLSRLAPYKDVVDREMNVKVGYVPQTLWVGAPECPLLNWLTDALWSAAKKVYPARVDVALVNMGSVRAEWLPGDLTFGQIYQVMPFENMLVVLTLSGEDIIDLCASFAEFGAQGVAGMRVTIVDGQLADLTIGGKPVNPKKDYTLATSDYLTGGADNLTALTRYKKLWNSQLPIRDLYIQEAQQQDTIRAAVDGRMTIL